MKIKTNQKGSITVLVILSCLFFIMFLTGMFMLSSVKRQVQIEATKKEQNIYSQGNANEIYNNYFAEGVIPIYTKEQLQKICSGEQIAINEENGKIYNFSTSAIYLIKENIQFEYNGIWQMPSNFSQTGRIEGSGKKITIRDTSKSGEIYYYYTEDNNYKFPLTKEGYTYSNLLLHYDGINNTGSGHSSSTTTWKDLSGNGYNGTLNQFASSTCWEANQLRFDGVNDYIGTSLPQASMGNNITITAVCLAEATNNYRGLFGPYNSNAENYVGMYFQFADEKIVAGRPGSSVEVNIPEDYNYNKVIITCVLGSSSSKLYINGTLVGTATECEEFITTNSLQVGCSSTAQTNRYWLGTVSSFMVYNKTLTEEEIAQNDKTSKERFKLRNGNA